jgi:hyperosmotically inducible protein
MNNIKRFAMKVQLNKFLLLFPALLLTTLISLNSCKSKVKDGDLKSSVEAALRANPETAGVSVEVKDGVATLGGQVTDESARAKASELAKATPHVKSVENNITVSAPPPAPVEISPDEALTSRVKDATKDYPGVTATVNDGVVSVSGNIKRDAWRKLKEDLDGLKPKKVDASGLKISN